MSRGPNHATIDESNSSFSSSVGSDFNIVITQCQAEQEKARKLEDKLAGYKTVVQQIPKYQEAIAQLKKSEEDKARQITDYIVQIKEQQKTILRLEGQFPNLQGSNSFKQGLTDLDLCHPTKGAGSQSSSSPSFEIIGKSLSSNSIDKDILNSTVRKIASPTESNSSSPSTTLQYQEQGQELSPVILKGAPVNYKIITPEYVAGPPKNKFGLSRGISTNSAPSLSSSRYSPLSQLNSLPVGTTGSAKLLALAIGQKKPIWQMEQEAFMRRLESLDTTQQNPIDGAALTPAAASPEKCFDPGQTPTSSNSAKNENQVELSGKGARLKEWKPLNTMIPEPREDTNQYYGKSSDFSAANPDNDVAIKMADNLDYKALHDPEILTFQRPDRTFNLNNLNMAGKLSEETPNLVTRSSDDLMKFPSLHTNSPSPEAENSRMSHTGKPIYNRHDGGIGFSMDEQSSVTSQMESVLTILNKNDSPVEMSDMLYKFAENAKSMESRLNEYKEVIKMQTRQIQRLQIVSNISQEEENARLRDDISALKNENETLLDFIGALKENNEKETEPGWTSLFHSQINTDPVRSHYPDSPLMKKIESLSVMNAKLFHANKDWHNRWETLRQQTQEEKADLKSKVSSLETLNKNMKEKISCLEKELQIQNTSVKDFMKSSSSFEEEKSTLLRVNEALKTELTCLKTEIKDLTRSKRMMESELMSLKSSSKSKDSQQTGQKELQSEIGLLKQQLTIFKEDFDKERRDRLSAESKAEKFRKELKQTKLSLETRLQKMNAQIKIVENDLRTKARQNADLLYQVDDLKLKLQHELRKSSLALQNTYSFSHPPTSSYQGPASLPYNSELNGHTTNPNLRGTAQHQFGNSCLASASYLHHSSPEHLPGAWKCRHCTYVNYPNRTVCDICGYTVSNVESLPIAESESGRNELQSRGEERLERGGTDIVVDTE